MDLPFFEGTHVTHAGAVAEVNCLEAPSRNSLEFLFRFRFFSLSLCHSWEIRTDALVVRYQTTAHVSHLSSPISQKQKDRHTTTTASLANAVHQ